MKTMAEVIREELQKGGYQMPGDTLPYETQANAIAAHLTAAGFGPVKAAQAGALRDAAELIIAPGASSIAAAWLRARTASIEADQ